MPNAPSLLTHITEIYCHGGGAKGRVVPAVLNFLQKKYGLPQKFKVVHGISVGNFIALALMLGFTPEKMSCMLSQMPVDSFKRRTLKRTIKFFIKAIGFLFPRFSSKLRNTFEWAYYEAGAIREYFRRELVLNVFPEWKDRENIDCHLKKPIEKRYDPTFKQVYDKLGVLLKVHVTNANTNKTMIYSAETAPNTPISLAMMASIAIPGIYPPVVLDNHELAWDGGMSDRASDYTTPWNKRIHLRLMDEKGARVYFDKTKHPVNKLQKFNDAVKTAMGDVYNSNLLNLSKKEKRASVAIVVPLSTLNYNLSTSKQQELEKIVLEGVVPEYGVMKQLEMKALEREALEKRMSVQSPALLNSYKFPSLFRPRKEEAKKREVSLIKHPQRCSVV